MAKHHPIKPFPADIDRDKFGYWLSGFVDGEGCFILAIQCQVARQRHFEYPYGSFSIELRSDDEFILEQIQSYFKVGKLRATPSRGNSNPQIRYFVSRISELENVIVPHFEKFPLRAKKKRDFVIWKQGIDLLYHVSSRKTKRSIYKNGSSPKWTSPELDKFRLLWSQLKEQRKFNSSLILRQEPKPNPLTQRQPMLWDE